MRRSTVGIVGLIVAGAVVAPFLTPYYSGLALTAIAFALLGLSVNLVYGYLGYLSFGHAAFFGLGAYTAGLLYVKVGWPFAICAIVALVPPTALGALVGFASLRVSGAYFAIATLASAEVLRLVALSWVSMTRGPLGTVVPAPGFDGLEDAGIALYQYHLVIGVLLLGATVLVLRRLLRSPVGRSWLAIRESHDLAESVGIPTLRIKVVNIALSGALAGMAGVLLVPKVLVLSPDLFGPSYSAIALLIVILGGRGTLVGAVVGGVIFAVLPEMLRAIDEYRMVVFAALLLLVVRFQSDGIVGWIAKLRGRRDEPASPSVVTEAAVVPLSVPVQPTAAVNDVVLHVEGLQKHYAGVRAVDGSSFTVRAGEIFGIIGPNGAGKTTLLKLISGFEPVTAGTIASLGRDTLGLAPHALARLGVVRTFQHTELYRNLSVLDNVMIGTWLVDTGSTLACMLQGRGFRAAEGRRRAIAEDALRRVGLHRDPATRADALSYGEQKLLSIALALAAGPKLLLLDEPAAGLNHSEADRLRETLKSLRAGGLTIVVVDHNLQLMMSTCDRLLAVDHGVPLIAGTPAEVAADPAVREAYLG